jgi:hypothetical protein
MKLKLSLTIIFLFLFAQSFAIQAPQYQSYPTREEFEASGEAQVCKIVTDGCNEFNISETGSIANPIKSCKLTADFVYSWTCLQSKDNIYYF